MNSKTIPFRQELRSLRLSHPLFQSIHPFWLRCFRGRMALGELRLWALDVYPLFRDFARLYTHAATKCESESTLTFLAETIFEETGSGVKGESHPALFRHFLQALGVEPGELPLKSPTRAGQALWQFCWQTSRDGSFLDGVTLLGLGMESQFSHLCRMLTRTFERHYCMQADTLKFFAIHTVADVKHSQVASRIVSELAGTAAEQARVREVLFQLWDLQLQQLNELNQAARLQCDPA